MASDLWMTMTSQLSASGLSAALLYLDARLTLQANGASVLAANCLQACGKGRRGDLALMMRVGAVAARRAAQLARDEQQSGLCPRLPPFSIYSSGQPQDELSKETFK